MTTVTVEFSGICTHFLRVDHQELPAAHRVVLVDARTGRTINHVQIDAHVPSVIINNVPFPAEGMRLRLVATPAQDPLIYALSFPNVLPRLRSLIHEELETLSPPSRPVLLGEQGVVLYFDIDFGTFSAAPDSLGAIRTTLTVEAQEVTLEATPFAAGTVPAELQNLGLLPNGTTIVVANVDANPVRKLAADFYLHYLTAERLPANLIGPSEAPIVFPGEQVLAVGSGCSNSGYP